MTSEATMPNPADLLGKATNHVKEVVAGVQQSQLSDPTACSEWDVRGLINHLIGGLEFAAGAMAGNPPNIQLAAADSSHIGEHDASNLSQAYRDEVDRVLELASQPGTLEKVAPTPFGDMPMSQFLVGTWLDQFIHCWDLAKATGQDTTLEPELKAELQTQMMAAAIARRWPYASRQNCKPAPPLPNARRSAFMIGGTMYCCVTDTARRTRRYTSTLPILSHHPWGRLQPYE